MSDFKQLHVRTYSVVLKSQGCTSPPLLYNTNKKPPLGVWWSVYKPAHNESKYAWGCSFASTPPNHLLI